jgi:hypothetical protein
MTNWKGGIYSNNKTDYMKRYFREHYKTIKEKSSIRYKQNRINILNNNKQIRESLITLLGGLCIKCNTKDNLDIDHINGGGNEERRIRFNRSNHMMYRYYLSHPDEAKQKLQVLCKQHNYEKAKIYNEYKSGFKPHIKQCVLCRKYFESIGHNNKRISLCSDQCRRIRKIQKCKQWRQSHSK